jgi:hypothetical protein
MSSSPVNFGGRFDTPIPFDYDRDGKADLAVLRPGTGKIFAILSDSRGLATAEIGAPADHLFQWNLGGPAGSTLVSYSYSDGKWRFGNPLGFFEGYQFGGPSFDPVPGDFDGDSVTDVAVYRAADGRWHAKLSGGGDVIDTFGGLAADKPFVADIDGNGTSDRIIYRDGLWIIRLDSGSEVRYTFGTAVHEPKVMDFTQNGFPDLVVYNPNTGIWSCLENLNGSAFSAIPNQSLGGQDGDIPIPADYDGDGTMDLAVFRRGTFGQWWIKESSTDELRAGRGPIVLGRKGSIPGGQNIGFVDAGPKLEDLIGVPGVFGQNFVWKPQSENDHKLVVLIPRVYTDSVRAAWIADADGEIIEMGRFTTDSHNGNREHYRFNGKGGDYGTNIYLVALDGNRNLIHWPIPNGASRYDY